MYVQTNKRIQSSTMENTHNTTDRLTQFLAKFKDDVTPGRDLSKVKARILGLDQLEEAAQLIRIGQLVGFPTETVYGLGADATNEAALLSIYKTKKRPLSDPIIVHVLDQQQALELALTTPQQQKLFLLLTSKFWPGPFTVILRANPTKLPMVVTAGTGFVGLRSPKQRTARTLIQLSGLPIGAPSANLFGHVSPTEPIHVFNDFYDQEVAVIDGERCEYGLESTVVKLEEGRLTVLRQGSFTVEKLREGLKGSELEDIEITVQQLVKKQKQLQESPGQMFKHYSPNLPTYYTSDTPLPSTPTPNPLCPLSSITLISFSPKYQALKSSVSLYLRVGQQLNEQAENSQLEGEDCFCSAEEKKIMKEVYYLLRKAENAKGKVIVLGWEGERNGAIWDKVVRSTESKVGWVSQGVFYVQ